MSIRIILTVQALPGKAAELAAAYRKRCEGVRKEPGCEQFDFYQDPTDPERLVVLERWQDAAALEVHAKLTAAGAPGTRELCLGSPEREDYVYSRTR